MKIGLISDTHSYLDPKVFTYFEACEEIWHAGDIGSKKVLETLSNFRRTFSVFGNIDDSVIRAAVPEDLLLHRSGKKVLITHIAGRPPTYNSRVKKLIAKERPDLLICGHSHILKVEMDKKNNLLFVNPGAAGRQGFHKIKTLIRFEILAEGFTNLEVIELGPRGQLS